MGRKKQNLSRQKYTASLASKKLPSERYVRVDLSFDFHECVAVGVSLEQGAVSVMSRGGGATEQ